MLICCQIGPNNDISGHNRRSNLVECLIIEIRIRIQISNSKFQIRKNEMNSKEFEWIRPSLYWGQGCYQGKLQYFVNDDIVMLSISVSRNARGSSISYVAVLGGGGQGFCD